MAVATANADIVIDAIPTTEALGQLTTKAVELGFVVTGAGRDTEDRSTFKLIVQAIGDGFAQSVASALLELAEVASSH